MRTISLHDSRSGQVQILQPRDAGRVGIYACGPTVYSRVHVGNARPFVVFSLLKRFLEHEGLEATLVANITDINDKIYVAAREAGVPSERAGARDDPALHRRHRAAGARPARPRAARLRVRGADRGADRRPGRDAATPTRSAATSTSACARCPTYGELSHRTVDQMDQGEGVEGADRKEDPLDFALWKGEKEGEDTSWPSPWGAGRPGWHIECSAMAEELLGVELDIHGGGVDLLFPHHENEAAQTLGARGKPLARLWMHNGMLQLADEKMSKSEGNIRGLGEALDEVGRDALLMYFVGRPLPAADRLHARAPRRRGRERRAGPRGGAAAVTDGESPEELAPLRDAFFDALADDFNTAARAGRACSTGSARPTGARGRSAARTCARCSRCWRSTTCSTATEGAAGGARRARPPPRATRARRRTSPRRTGCATRSAPPAGRSATARTGRSSCPRHDPSAARGRRRPR